MYDLALMRMFIGGGYGGRGDLGLMLLAVLGLGLFWGCLKGMYSGEGMYDRDSRNTMWWANLLGMLIGAGLVAMGVWMVWEWTHPFAVPPR